MTYFIFLLLFSLFLEKEFGKAVKSYKIFAKRFCEHL